MTTLPRKIQPNLLYAVSRNTDGQFSRGGTPPGWGNVPKTWAIGPFKNHLLQFAIRGSQFNREARELGFLKSTLYTESYYANPCDFTKHKLLHDRIFPYFDCDVLEVNSLNFDITGRYNAPEWVWENVYFPSYKKNKAYDRYIKDYCDYYGLVI